MNKNIFRCVLILITSYSLIWGQSDQGLIKSYLKIVNSNQELVLEFGIAKNATDSIDSELGEIELPPLPPSGIFDVRFISPNDNALGLGSLVDIRRYSLELNQEFVHQLNIQRGTNSNLKISWDISNTVKVNLKDLFNGIVINKDIEGKGEFEITNDGISSLLLTAQYTIKNNQINSPTNLNAVISNNNIKLNWDDNSNNEDGFIIERKLASDVSFSEINKVSTDAISFIDTTISSNRIYQYRVSAYNSLTNSDYSNVVQIEIITTSLIEEIVSSNYYLSQNFPNPFNPSTKIKYLLPNSGYVSIKVYDSLGKEIKNLVGKFLNKGEYQVDFNAENLSSGIYYYKLETNNYSESKKMLLIK